MLFKTKQNKTTFAHSHDLPLIIRRARLLTTHISANPRWPRLLFSPTKQSSHKRGTFRPEKWNEESLIQCPTPFPCRQTPPGIEKQFMLTFPANSPNSWWLQLRFDARAFLNFSESNFVIALFSFTVRGKLTILFPPHQSRNKLIWCLCNENLNFRGLKALLEKLW